MNAMNNTTTHSTGTEKTGANKSRNPSAELQALTRRGIVELIAFLLISTVFFFCRHTDLFAPMAESVRQILGCPPPPALTAMAMTGYIVSAAILIIHRTADGQSPQLKWSNLFLRSVFYIFHGFSGSLETHFMGVFVGGLILFALEHLNIWAYSLKIMPDRKALLGKL